MRKADRALRTLTFLNLAFLAFLWLLETGIAERHWLTTLITYMPQHPFGIPAVILVLWSLFGRRWKMLVLNLIASAFFLYTLMGFCLPLHRVTGKSGFANTKVMTLNVHHFPHGIGGVVALIEKENPHIVCLQEVNAGETGDPLRELVAGLPGWHAARDREVATLTQWRITGVRVHRTIPSTGRVVLETVITGIGRYKVLNVHLSTASTGESFSHRSVGLPRYLRHTAKVRSEQMARIMEFAAQGSDTVVIAGDFNTPPRGRLYRRMSGRYRDAFRSAGFGFGYTYRSGTPVMRIDYIFVGRTGVCDARVVSTEASDHRAVVAEMW